MSRPDTLTVAVDPIMRILTALSLRPDDDSVTHHLCDVAADVTGMSGAGIMLMAGGRPQGSLCTTDDISTLIEDLQYTLGEGPCVDAHELGEPILEANLEDPTTPRWPAFTSSALTAGARAVFGFPVRIGNARLGALNLYRNRPGPLSDEQHADALLMAEIAARSILAIQAFAPPGTVAADLETEADFRLVVHQAAGMVSVQLDVDVGDALVRLRAHAFSTNRPITEVAEDVVSRQLRFEAH